MKRILLVLAYAFLLNVIFLSVLPLYAYIDIAPKDVLSRMNDHEDFFIADVREPFEYAQGYVPHAHLIPLAEVEDRLNEFPRDKEIIVVCKSGGRSKVASQTLDKQGFQNVRNMVGGTLAWAAMPYFLSVQSRDLKDRYDSNATCFVDVRESPLLREGSIPLSLAIPLEQIENRLGEIPQDKEIVVVGRNEKERFQAAQKLINTAYKDVKTLEGDLTIWGIITPVAKTNRLPLSWGRMKKGY